MLEDWSIQNCFRFVMICNCFKNKTHNTWHSLYFLENVELSGCILRLELTHYFKVSTMLLILKSKFVITFTKQKHVNLVPRHWRSFYSCNVFWSIFLPLFLVFHLRWVRRWVRGPEIIKFLFWKENWLYLPQTDMQKFCKAPEQTS